MVPTRLCESTCSSSRTSSRKTCPRPGCKRNAQPREAETEAFAGPIAARNVDVHSRPAVNRRETTTLLNGAYFGRRLGAASQGTERERLAGLA